MSQNVTVVSPEPLASCLGGRGEHDWAISKLPERERGE